MLAVFIWHVWETKAACNPRTLIPTMAVSKPSEKGRRQPYVQKQALIREEAVPALQTRLLRLKIS